MAEATATSSQSEEQEISNALNNKYSKKKMLELLAIVALTVVVWNLPTEIFGIKGLTVVQQRVIAVFVFATLSWLTEAIPSWATSLAIITTMCLTISNNALAFFKGEENETFGTLLKSKEIMAAFADPVIMLFLGGFVLAIAATKSGLDVLLAKNLIRPFGKKSENVLLGFLLITGLFSMFVSNTATAAMMLTFLTPVFAALPDICSGHKVIDVGGMHVQFEELQSFPAEAGGGFIHVDDHRQVR